MSNLRDVKIQSIDHLGIIAGIIDSIGLVEIINEIVGQAPDEKVSPGHVVKAMILNGMGFVSSPLYMFPKFFKDKPCEYNTSLPNVIFNHSSGIEIKAPQAIEITYGYSRDHRPDLKQFIIELISSADEDIPIFIKPASGNQSDSSSFAQIFLEY